jgi:uncharacterized protein YbaR (Trm112 family)
MHLLLTDVLDCPQCLEGAGLILLAGRVEGRTVHEGDLGCPLCRRKYPVRNGIAEFGPGAESSVEAGDDAAMMAALLGVSEPPATILLIGRYARQAEALAGMVDGMQVVVADAATQQVTHPNVSVLTIADVVPLRARTVRGVWLSDPQHMREAARVCALASRMVVNGVTPYTSADVESLGFRTMAQDADRLVAVRVS